MNKQPPHHEDYQGGLSLAEAQAHLEKQLKNSARGPTIEIHKLSSNENPLGPSPAVIEKLSQVATSLHFYPPRQDLILRQAIACSPVFAANTITSDHVCCSHGASSVLELIIRTFVKADEQVLITPPTFGLYKRIAFNHGIECIRVPLSTSDFSVPLDALLRAITPSTRLLVLCSPNNPTGTSIDKAVVNTLLQCLPPDAKLLIDEAYIEYAGEENSRFSTEAILAEENVISLRSFSKIHGLAGLRLGYAIAPPSIASTLRQRQNPFHLSSMQIEGGIAALSDRDHALQTRTLNMKGKQQLYNLFDELELEYWKSEANFVLFRPKRQANLTRELLLERGFMVRETESFDLPGCLRVSTGSPSDIHEFSVALKEITR